MEWTSRREERVMGLVIFFAVVIVVVLAVAVYHDVRRRNTNRTADDWYTAQHPRKPREGSEFRHGPPGDVGGAGM
jgi:hypothetical protein